jgi:endonuclease YncB( thermonuclease family)
MKTIFEISLCCVLSLFCSHFALAQSSKTTDPCGDPVVESQSFHVVYGKVVKVEDGDTVIISLKGRKLRRVNLIGIDAPERSEAFTKASHLLLESLVNGRNIEVWVNDNKWIGRQMPAEIAGVVHLRNIEMLDVNLLMIQSGMARHKKSEPYSMSNYIECHYARAEEDARAARRGLWRGAA